MTERTGTSPVIFGYNGRDGVVTDENGLIYMRARYYSPDMRRFINADVVAGNISNAITLNRYAYANGNPVSNIDPFGLSAERGTYASSSSVFWDKCRNKNGSYSLYDNDRFENHNAFHEQIFAVALSGPSLDLGEGDFGLFSVEVDVVTGGK